MSAEIEVGRVVGLNRFAVKSMRGESSNEMGLGFTGFKGDRQYAFVKLQGVKSVNKDFPWFTGRDYPPIFRWGARYTNPLDPENSPVEVKSPDGRNFSVDSDDLRREIMTASGKEIYLLRLGRGAYDGMHVSILGIATVDAIRKRSGVEELEPSWFRPNIVVETVEQREGFEDDWVGGLLIIGEREDSPRVLVVRKDPRCMQIGINPKTGQQKPEIHRDVLDNRKDYAGVYASVAQKGWVRVGDTIRLVKLF